MEFNKVISIITNLGDPPHSDIFKYRKNDYLFYPFNHNGKVVTADHTVWGNITKPAVNYFPSPYEAMQIIKEFITRGNIIMLLSNSNEFPTIDHNRTIQLSTCSKELEDRLSTNFVNAGFDVIDYYSGISAVTNIGYTSQDMIELNNSIDLTGYGLIEKASDAYIFSNFASKAAPEHSLFHPVKIYVCFRVEPEINSR